MRNITSEIPRRLPTFTASLVILALFPATGALAAKWTTAASITAIENYADNASLGAPRTGGEFITQVAPSIQVSGEGARFKGNLAYTATGLAYSRSSSQDQIANTLNANGTLEAVRNFFYVDAFGNISRTYISPFAPQPANFYSITSNRIESRTYGLSPYVQGRVRDAFSYSVRYNYTDSSSDSSALAGLYTTEWTAHAASPIIRFGWALDYDDNTVTYRNNAQHLSSKFYRGTLYYRPDPRWLLSLDAGQEQNNYSVETQTYSTYGAGAQWKPTPTTSAELNVEHRFFGVSRLASFKHRTPRTDWTVTYSKSVTNYPQALLTLQPGNVAALLDAVFAGRIPDPAARRAAVDQFLRTTGIPAFLSNQLTFYTQQALLEERLDASAAILGKRSSLLFNVFRDKSQALSANFTSSAPDAFSLAQGGALWQTGFGVSAQHNVTPFTSLGASATRTYARQDVPSTQSSRNDYLALTLNHTASPKTTTFAGLGYVHFATSGAASTSSSSRSIFAGLTHRF